MNKKYTLATLVALISLSPLHGAVTLAGNYQFGDPTPTMKITEDLVFNVTASGSLLIIVFDELTPYVGNSEGVSAISNQMNYQLNGGTTKTAILSTFINNFGYTANNVSPNDGFMYFTAPISVVKGDVLVFKPATLTFGANANFHGGNSGTINTPIFATNDSGQRLSLNATSIPEPTNTALLGMLGFMALIRRKR